MKKYLLAGLMVAAAVPALAQVGPIAGVQPIQPAQRLRPMSDGVMTRSEVSAMVQAQFARRDTNRDGFIAQNELAAVQGAKGMRHQLGDRHGQRAGRMGDPNAAFARLDVNRDGMISRDEFGRARQIRSERRVAMNGAQAMRGHRMGGGFGGRMLQTSDLNHDGRMSIQEAQVSALQHFDLADSNRDGRVTRDEMRAAHQRMAPRAG